MTTARLVSIKNKFINILNNVTEQAEKIKLPQRFHGTIIDKWAIYWKQLCIDYREVAIDVIKDTRKNPLKASIYGTLIGTAYIFQKKNPTEDDFMQKFRNYNNDLVLVHPHNHRLESSDHLRLLERSVNEGVLRYFSFGIASIIWLDNYDENCAIYKAICPHLQIDYTKFNERIIDIGFWNKWWKLEDKMIDYDINL